MGESIMIRMNVTDDCIAISTYSRERGRRGRFLILKSMLQEWYDHKSDRTLLDYDCGDYLRMSLSGDMLSFRIDWLNQYGNDNLKGFTQTFKLPVEALRALLSDETPIVHLYGTTNVACGGCTSLRDDTQDMR